MIRLAPILALLLAGCGLFGSGSSGQDRELLDARARWEALGWEDYDMTLMRGCFCVGAGNHEVWVRDEEVIAVWPAGEWPVEFPPVWWEHMPTLDELFDLVERADREADHLEVEYDEAGWPSRIDIDWWTEAVDDEISYRVESVTEAAPSHTVTLAPGDTFSKSGTTIRFDAITADSRCPLHVNCVWAGEATASFTATLPAGGELKFELTDPPGSLGEDRSVEVGTLRVTLITVTPYPEEPGTIDADAYRVRLLVETL
jgi:hypothetical protein